MLKCCEYVAHGQDFDFQRDDIEIFRKQMVLQIYGGSLDCINSTKSPFIENLLLMVPEWFFRLQKVAQQKAQGKDQKTKNMQTRWDSHKRVLKMELRTIQNLENRQKITFLLRLLLDPQELKEIHLAPFHKCFSIDHEARTVSIDDERMTIEALGNRLRCWSKKGETEVSSFIQGFSWPENSPKTH